MVKVTRKRIAVTVAAVFGAGVTVVMAGLIFSLVSPAPNESFSIPIPSSWVKTNETGNIAAVCMGSWEECGSITRTYDTRHDIQTALQELRSSVKSKGWVLEGGTTGSNPVQVAVKNDAAIAYVSLSNLHASIRYVKR